MLEETLASVSRQAAAIANWMALLVVAFGTVEAFVGTIRLLLRGEAAGHPARAMWLQFSRWLVAGLTFQLAGDVISTAAAPSWADIGMLAVVAAVRTFLNFFLERDMADLRARDAGE